MNRRWMVGALLAATVAATPAFAQPPGAPGPCRCGEEADPPGKKEMSPERLLQKMTRRLGLNEGQQAKIGAILTADRETAGPLMKQVAESRRQLRETVRAKTFDEAAIRSSMAKLSVARTDLLVAHARTRSNIREILTPEQRNIADRFPQPGRRGHRGHRGGQDGFGPCGGPPEMGALPPDQPVADADDYLPDDDPETI